MAVIVVKGASQMSPAQLKAISDQHERMLGHAASMMEAAQPHSMEVNNLASALVEMIHDKALDACTTERTVEGPLVNTAVLMGAYVQVSARLLAMLWDMPERSPLVEEEVELHKVAAMQGALMQVLGMACAILKVEPEVLRSLGITASQINLQERNVGHG